MRNPRVFLFIISIFILVAILAGCAAEPDKRGYAIIQRDAGAALASTGDGHELDRILEQADALLKAYGQPDRAVLLVAAPQLDKDTESKTNAKEIVENASWIGGLFGGWMGWVLSIGGSLGAIGVLAYTGRWGLAAKQLMALFTQGVEEGKNNGELKKFLAKATKGTTAGKLLDKYVVKAEIKVNGDAPT